MKIKLIIYVVRLHKSGGPGPGGPGGLPGPSI